MSTPTAKLNRTAASPEELRQWVTAAKEAGKRIPQNPMSLRQWLTVVQAFREQGMPPGRPGRRQSRQVTGAYQDWQKGVRGIELFRKHIPRWERLSYYARQIKAQRLMAAIRKRLHREKARTKPATVTQTKPLA